ncbi:YheC/YheD family protein [Brevibacillus borstelensis]|uniref:YheC/YheD family protein n=1 Tax=Brevibacillus borstelensis TaxID=45462 RepID=UPI0030BFD091
MIPSSKWSLHKFFDRHPIIRSYLPATSLYQPALLDSFLQKYDTVYIKPSSTHMGKGIMKVWKTDGGYALVKERGQSVTVSTLGELKQLVDQNAGNAKHIIQKGIPLAEVNRRPFDIRVMMLRNGAGKWQYAGMLAKVAGPDSVITNVARGGGYVTTVRQALLQSGAVKPEQASSVIRELVRLSHQVCTHFNKYKHSSQIGIDWAIDKKGTLSVIEVNFDFPSHGLFAKLPDKTYYRTIKRLRSQYLARRARLKKRKPASR